MKTIALPFAGLAVWLAFLFPAPALAEEVVTEERAAEMFLDYTALAQRCWPDLLDEQSPLFLRTIELYRATPTTPGYEWLARDPRRSFFLAKIAADQLGIAAAPGTPVLEMTPIRVVAAAPTPAPAAPVVQAPAPVVVRPLGPIVNWGPRIGVPAPDPEQEALDSARVRQRVMESRLAEIQRQLRKLERR